MEAGDWMKKFLLAALLFVGCGSEDSDYEPPVYHSYKFDPYVCYNDNGIQYIIFNETTLCMRYVCWNGFVKDNCRRELTPYGN